MKPPVETVRIGKQAREILTKIRRRTGLERWNDISRAAFCRSLANERLPSYNTTRTETALEIEWKTFSGELSDELSALFWIRARKDSINCHENSEVSKYFRAHVERGISSLQNTKEIRHYMNFITEFDI